MQITGCSELLALLLSVGLCQSAAHGAGVIQDEESLLHGRLPAIPDVVRPVPWTRFCTGFWCVFEGIPGLSSDEWMTGEEPRVAPRPLIV